MNIKPKKEMPIGTKKVSVVVPVYNEAPILEKTIKSIRDSGFESIIVVDDGSSDDSYIIALKMPVTVLRHSQNKGKGAALQTGLAYAQKQDSDIIATIDADGQHNPKDILKAIAVMETKKCEVVLGVRNINLKSMPPLKVFGNYMGKLATYLKYRLWITDSQCGFRVYSRHALTLINCTDAGYEFESAVIGEIKKHNLSFEEVLIETIYTPYSQQKKSRLTPLKSVWVFFKILLK